MSDINNSNSDDTNKLISTDSKNKTSNKNGFDEIFDDMLGEAAGIPKSISKHLRKACDQYGPDRAVDILIKEAAEGRGPIMDYLTRSKSQCQQQQQQPKAIVKITPPLAAASSPSELLKARQTQTQSQPNEGDTKNDQFQGVSGHDIPTPKIEQNGIPSPYTPSPSKPIAKAITPPKGPVFTSVSQLTSYLKVDRIQADINALEPDWPIFGLKELGANCYDFFRVRYPNAPKESRKVAFCVRVDRAGILRINVRNSSVDNVEVFKNLEQIFDYKSWGSEKRNQHNMTQGSLGDFLKRVLGMCYASWTSVVVDDENNSFANKQWPEPVILRFNKKEYKVFLVVEDGPNPYPKFDGPHPYEDASNYTEVEIALPLKHYLPDPSQQEALLDRLQQFYMTYKMAQQRNIDFSFTDEGVARE